MATPEGKVKAAIKKRLDELGLWRAGAKRPDEVRGWYYMPANNGMGVSGIPDFVGSFNHGQLGPWPFAIEAKGPDGRATALQLERHFEMTTAGWLVLVVNDVSQLSVLEKHLG